MAALRGHRSSGEFEPWYTSVNVNVPDADVTLASVNDLGIHGILVSVNGLGAVENRTNWTRYHSDLLHS